MDEEITTGETARSNMLKLLEGTIKDELKEAQEEYDNASLLGKVGKLPRVVKATTARDNAAAKILEIDREMPKRGDNPIPGKVRVGGEKRQQELYTYYLPLVATTLALPLVATQLDRSFRVLRAGSGSRRGDYALRRRGNWEGLNTIFLELGRGDRGRIISNFSNEHYYGTMYKIKE